MTLNAPRTHGGPAEDKTALSYPLVVEWSEEDQVFIGSCPGITGPCCHGADPRDVLRQLVQIVNDWLQNEEEIEVAVG